MQIQYTKNLNPERFELDTERWVSRIGLFESEVKFTAIFSWRWVRTLFAITTQLQWTFESTKFYFRSTAAPHMQRSLLAFLTSLGSSSLFTDPLFSLEGSTIWLLKGGGMGILVWVRICFPKSLEIEFWHIKMWDFFQHYTPCWKFFWVQVIFFRPLRDHQAWMKIKTGGIIER